MPDLKVSLIQTELHWENIDKNLEHFSGIMDSLEGATDLIILPEMFSTGFSMNVQTLAEAADGKTVKWMAEKARQKNCVVTGSIIAKENGKVYNRLIWMAPSGEYEVYDKRHLFKMHNEHHHFFPGNKRLIIKVKGWNVCPQICYDLRFPVWNRNRKEYELLLFVANWPEKRNFAWKHLLQARAIENQSYVVGLNRIGNDGNGIYHSGDSSVIDPMGEVVFTQADTAFAKIFMLSKERVQSVREKIPFLDDADDFEIRH